VDKIGSILLQSIRILSKIMSMFDIACPFMLSCFIKTRLATIATAPFLVVRAVRCLLLPGHQLTVPYFHNFSSYLFKLTFVQPLFGNSVINCLLLMQTFDQNFSSLLNRAIVQNGPKWYAVKTV